MQSTAVNPASKRRWVELLRDRSVMAWVAYDWANSAFAVTVMAGFFPIFFKKYWSTGVSTVESTAKLGYANSVASLLLGLLAPFLGALADRASGRKKLLLLFTIIGAVSTAAFYLIEQGAWAAAAALYVLASVGYSGSQSFYDSLLTNVASPEEMDHVSGLGYGIGYLGGGLLFACNVVMTLKPELFGLRDATQAVQTSFLLVGVWWLLFTLPIMTVVKEPQRASANESMRSLLIGSARELIETFHHLRQNRTAFMFLIAYFFYIDGVGTMIKMAVDYGMSLGFQSNSLIVALLLVQFVSFPAAIGFSFFSQRFGAKLGLNLTIAVYALVTIAATQMQVETHFYVMAIVIGLVQGGIQALSRSVFGQLIPPEKSGEFFGFFNMIGRFSSILGPVLIALTGLVSNSSRVSILSLLILFGIGAWLLNRVPFPKTAQGR